MISKITLSIMWVGQRIFEDGFATTIREKTYYTEMSSMFFVSIIVTRLKRLRTWKKGSLNSINHLIMINSTQSIRIRESLQCLECFGEYIF